MARRDPETTRSIHERALLARANVVGVGIGHKVVGGEETDETCIVVFVERKVPPEALRRRDLVPPTLRGIRTDVVETGRFVARELAQAEEVSRTSRVRPAPGGVSLGHVRITAGTLGVLLRTVSGEDRILSNNHVLANSNAASPGDLILQPGPADGGTLEDAVARLVAFEPIRFKEREIGPVARLVERRLRPLLARLGLSLGRLPSTDTNLVDAAIARPLAEDLVSPDILGIGRVAGTTEARVGLQLRKSGRTTGLTAGKVTALAATVEVDYRGATAVFREQIVGDVLSRGGDSGSLVVDEANRAVGLLFAGGANTTILNPIAAVLEALRLTL